MPLSPRLVLQEPDEDTREALAALLEDSGYEVIPSESTDASLFACAKRDVDLVIADFPADNGSAELVAAQQLMERCQAKVGVITGARRLRGGDAQRQGWAFLLWKPFSFEHLLSAVAAAVAPAVDPARSADARVVHAYFERLSAHDWDGVAALCREDVIYRLPGGSRRAAEVRGRPAFRAFTEKTFRSFTDVRFDDVRCVRTPDRLIAGYTGRWTQPDGARIELPGYVVFRLDGGEISEIGIRLDDAQLERVDPGVFA